jgi:two-component system response regulator RegA
VSAPSVLLVDDDAIFRERLARAFRERGFVVETHGSVEAARSADAAESPEFAVIDLRMPGASGLDLVRELHARDAATRIVVLTGYGSIATAVQAVKDGAADYLSKPLDFPRILAALLGTQEEPGTGQGDWVSPSLARLEWEHIQRVLLECEGNITRAAKALGLHRRSLQRKLDKYPARR